MSSPLQVRAVAAASSPKPPPPAGPLDAPPDGGLRAWLVVCGSTLALFASTGIVNAYGVFQAYYTRHLLARSSSSTISLVGALQVALVYGGGPVTGRLFDAYGLDVMFPLGALLAVLSQILVSICREDSPYQFFLSHSLLGGLGSALIFTPALAVIAHWFRRRRAYVFGIVVAGSSLGGVVYPVMLQQLIPAVGFPWAVRISAFFTLLCLLLARLTIRTRIPLRGHVHLPQLIDLHGFRDPRYALATAASFLYFYAVFIPYFYVEEYAVFRGVAPHVARYLLPIINGCGVPARIIPGFLGDRFGVLQVLIPPTLLSGTIVLALWLPARGAAPLVLFSVLYGTVASGFVSMLPAYVASISPAEKFGARLGMLYFFVALGSLVGTPTAGAFVPVFAHGNFERLIVFTGVLELAAAALMGVAYVLGRRARGEGDAAQERERERERERALCEAKAAEEQCC